MTRVRALGSFLLTLALLAAIAACGNSDTTTNNTFTPASYAGNYTGRWQNATFGSTGNAAMTVTLNEAESTATVVLDLDGNVLGGADPDPVTVTVPYTADGGTFTGEVGPFGPMTITIQNVQINASANAVPSPAISSIAVTGQRVGDTLTLNYTVTFADNTTATATGTLTLTRG